MAKRRSGGNGTTLAALQAALDAEMAGVVLYTHLALRVFGPQMHGIVAHLRGAAAESLQHAEKVGDLMTALGGVPRLPGVDTLDHSPRTLDEILRICLVHERRAIDLYRAVLASAGDDIVVEEFARSMIVTESEDAVELEKLLRPMG